MRILHVLASRGLYGAERVVLELIDEHQRAGHRPILASIAGAGAPEPAVETEARRRGLPVEGLRMLDGPNLRGAWRLARLARARGIDVIHAHGFKGNILLGFLPRRLRGAPRMIATLHGWIGIRRYSPIWCFEALEGRVLRRLDAVVTVDPGLLDHPRLRRVPRHRLQAIANGVAPAVPRSPPPDPAVASFCSSGPTLMAVGRLSPEKGWPVLLEALREGLRRGADLRLALFGDGPERQRIEDRTQALGLRRRVLLAGYVPEVRYYMPGFDAFVLPSWSEGWPLCVVEAMLAGLPVVATAVGAVPEQLDHGRAGLLVPPGDPSALAEALCRLDRRPALARCLARRARTRAVERYTSAAMARAYEHLYRSLAVDRRPSR